MPLTAPAAAPSVTLMPAGARTASSAVWPSASVNHADWPATSPPVGAETAEVTPPVRAIGMVIASAS